MTQPQTSVQDEVFSPDWASSLASLYSGPDGMLQDDNTLQQQQDFTGFGSIDPNLSEEAVMGMLEVCMIMIMRC